MKKVPQKFKKWFDSHFLDQRDLIDLEHEYDKDLTIEENKEAFKQKFGIHYHENPKEVRQKIKSEQEQARAEKKQNELIQRKAYLEQRFGIKLEFAG